MRPVLIGGVACRWQPVQGEGRLRDGAHGQRYEGDLVVFASNPVGVKLAAGAALVDDRPVAASAHPDGNGLHRSAAIGGAVARHIVYVFAPEAPGAVIAVRRAERFAGDGLPTACAAEPFRLDDAATACGAIDAVMAVPGVQFRMRLRSQRCVLSFLSVRRRAESDASEK